jgi:hypothetical protein
VAIEDLNTAALWEQLVPTARPEPAVVQDWLGNRWPTGTFPALPAPGWQGPRTPEGGDGFRAGILEWTGLAVAASLAAADPSTPATAVEMGASQAPWCLSWVRALTRLAPGRSAPIRAVAYEAAAGKDVVRAWWAAQDLDLCVAEQQHGLLFKGQGWQVEWREQAVLTGGGTARFPDVDISQDNGAQAVREALATDYRGHPQRYREVQAVDPGDAVEELGHVHFLHMDVQGAEEQALRSGFASRLRGQVDVLMVGTHTRAAEALAFEELPDAGFVLVEEEPCLHQAISGHPRLVKDGEQLWISNKACEYLDERGLLHDPALLALSRERTAMRPVAVALSGAARRSLAATVISAFRGERR